MLYRRFWGNGRLSAGVIILVLSRTVRHVPALLNLSNEYEIIFTEGRLTIATQLQGTASMTHDSTQSPDLNHRYDFGDSVFVMPLGKGGFVKGMCRSEDGKFWFYCLSCPLQTAAPWWREDQLQQACPRCLMPWEGIDPCSSCGAIFD
ncbi:MAG TPA: hypothetical protein V6C65_18160 [Allocoleopsis sp.]